MSSLTKYVIRLAGVDASAVVASYILWRFAGLPQDVKEKIHEELDVAMPDSMIIPDLKTLQSLPLLDGLIKEGKSLISTEELTLVLTFF